MLHRYALSSVIYQSFLLGKVFVMLSPLIWAFSTIHFLVDSFEITFNRKCFFWLLLDKIVCLKLAILMSIKCSSFWHPLYWIVSKKVITIYQCTTLKYIIYIYIYIYTQSLNNNWLTSRNCTDIWFHLKNCWQKLSFVKFHWFLPRQSNS